MLTKTKLNRLFPNYQTTLNLKIKRRDLKIWQEKSKKSLLYLRKIGFEKQTGLSIKNNRILINDKQPKPAFSQSEEKILKKLFTSAEKPVSYFELGDLLWQKNEERFSLWALSQLVYKLRKKIMANGLREF